MSKIFNLITTYKNAIIWSACYCVVIWGILLWLFNFDIFSLNAWAQLPKANLNNFPGLVFVILLLAAIPLYIATTTLIIRTKKPLFTIPIPKFLYPVPEKEESTESKKETKDNPETNQPIAETLPAGIPAELRTPFLRAREHIRAGITTPPVVNKYNEIASAANMTDTVSSAPSPTTNNDEKRDTTSSVTDTNLPIPDDFDFEVPDTDDSEYAEESMPHFSPVFTDIDFDEKDGDSDDDATTESQETVIKFLQSRKESFEQDQDIIISDNFVIGIHSDPDFWIADEELWFAAGKQKESPIKKIQDIALSKQLQGVLYLAETNIMDLDTKISEWSESGIKVITSISELE